MESISVNNLKLTYTRRGQGAPLMLVHGFPLDGSIWGDVAKELESQFDLIIPNLRGFGGSTAPQTQYSMNDLADDLAALLDALKLTQVALAGHSMGGYVALAFAKKYRQRVRALGLVASQALADNAERKEGRYKTALDVERNGVAVVAESMGPKLSAGKQLQDVARELILKQSKAGVIGALKAMAEREDQTSTLKSAPYPIVLIHGAADALIPIDRAREIKALVRSAKLTELPEIGHLPMFDAADKTALALSALK